MSKSRAKGLEYIGSKYSKLFFLNVDTSSILINIVEGLPDLNRIFFFDIFII